MVLVVKCLICNKELTYTQDDPSELIYHVKKEHRLSTRKSEYCCQQSTKKQTTETDLDKSLRLNSEILKEFIDKEIQTEIGSNFFERMSSNCKIDIIAHSTPRTSNDSKNLQLESANVSVVEKTFSPPVDISNERRKIDEKTPLKTLSPLSSSTSKQHKENPATSQNDRIDMKVGRDVRVLFTKDAKMDRKTNEKPLKTEKNHAKFYITSIEKWRPVGDEKIHCPRCQSLKRPIVRTHTERVTQSSFASTLVMTCWPICFSPCLFPEPTHENLHCPVCNYHLGVYDHQKKMVQSNPEITTKK
jgi:hypothetical protein